MPDLNLDKDALADHIRNTERLLVVYHAGWCPVCRSFLPEFERATADAPIDVAGADLYDEEDPRWDTARVRIVPTLVLYEKGEEAARLDGKPMIGITRGSLRKFLEKHTEASK